MLRAPGVRAVPPDAPSVRFGRPCRPTGGNLARAGRGGAPAEGRGAHRVGRVLLRDGLIGQNELALRVVTTIADATGELLQAETAGPVRFVPGERHWLGDMPTQRLRGVPKKRKPALR